VRLDPSDLQTIQWHYIHDLLGNSQAKSEQSSIEEMYVVETELKMVPVEHTKTTEEEEIIYELTEEEERLGIKF